MAALAFKEWEFETAAPDLIALEAQVIRTLDWGLLFAGPLFFLERYLRLFGLDQAKHHYEAARTSSLAKDLLRLTILDTIFLRFHCAVIAASALLLSININSSPAAQQFGMPSRLPNLRGKCSQKTAALMLPGSSNNSLRGGGTGPLSSWDSSVAEFTRVSPDQISPCYKVLVQLAN